MLLLFRRRGAAIKATVTICVLTALSVGNCFGQDRGQDLTAAERATLKTVQDYIQWEIERLEFQKRAAKRTGKMVMGLENDLPAMRKSLQQTRSAPKQFLGYPNAWPDRGKQHADRIASCHSALENQPLIGA